MRLELANLPLHLRDSAFAVGNGELLWKRGAALDIAGLAPRLDVAILGGEIYEARAGFGWATYLRSWETSDADSDLSWPDFVDAGRREAIAEIEGEFSAGLTPDADARRTELLYFFIAVCSRAEYEEARLTTGRARSVRQS